MESIQYVGEHLLPGKIGHALVVIAFITAIVAVISGLLHEKYRSTADIPRWKNLMRWSFIIHLISVVGIMSTIFFMMFNHYYEYKYVQAHVSDTLPMRYILAAFWEGQEGSFLLWMLWNSVLGCIIIRNRDRWENLVIACIALCQILLTSMIFGVYIHIGDYVGKIGSSPFVLLRNTIDAPIFSNPNYLELIKGQGLNVLLQNYWNTIHPPTLFMGFASTIIPFAYAISSLIRGEYLSWLKPARNWALFSAFVLGLGICMGAAWAYEALTFGGYWAWDPVENMSFVPWLFLIAGLHANVIVLSTRQSLKSTYVFYFLAFNAVLYSTFLTRSGVLQETSVHAFTQDGLGNQLITLLSLFSILSIIAYFFRRKNIPVPAKEEPVNSKEFWMYMGSLVIMISAFLITYGTSLPIINNIVQYFDPSFEDMVIEDAIAHYNKHQLWIGVLLGILTAVAQFFRFRGARWNDVKNQVYLQIGGTAVMSALLTFLSSYIVEATAWQYQLLLFSAWYAIIGNLLGFFMGPKKNYALLGSTTSHMGFGILLLGIIITGLNQRIISSNLFAQRGLAGMEDSALKKNLILLKGEPMIMGNYKVTYLADSMNNQYRHFFVKVEELGENMTTVTDSFMLYPNVIYTRDFTDIEALNPGIRRGLFYDMFTRITRLPMSMVNLKKAATMDDSLNYIDYAGYIGDTVYTSQYAIIIKDFKTGTSHPKYEAREGDYPISAVFEIYDIEDDTSYYANPTLLLRGPMAYTLPVEKEELDLRIRLRDTIFSHLLLENNELNYTTIGLDQGDTARWRGYTMRLVGVNTDPKRPGFTPKEGDLAVGVKLQLTDKSGNTTELEPLYIIRERRASGIRDIDFDSGLYVKVKNIDPQEQKFYIDIAQGRKLADSKVYFELVEDVPENEFIVFQATIMPGINLVWMGMILMLSGLMITLIIKKRQKRSKRLSEN